MEPSLPDIYPNDIGTEIYEGLQPLIDKYGDVDQHLWIYLHGLAWMLKPVDDIAKDGPDGEPGWSQIFDLARAKTEWLPWIGNITGYAVPKRKSGQSFEAYDAEQRERLITRSAYRRGTTQQMIDVIKEHLTGSKRVIVQERYGGAAYQIKVWVYTTEIATSQAEIIIAINHQKVAGLVLEFGALDPNTYDALRANSATYQVVKDKFVDYQDLLLDPDRVG